MIESDLRREHPGRSVAVLAASLLGACTAPDWQGRTDLQLREYHAAFARTAGSRFAATADDDELLALARRSTVLWLGDHHRNELLHDCQLRLLRRLHTAGIQLYLGLEAIGEADQRDVDDYLHHHLELDTLVAQARTRWPGTWLDDGDVDRDHYRRLLQFARASATPVFALEPTPRLPLLQRDPAIARNIGTAAAAHRDRLLVVIVGQAHLLGDGHLPERTGRHGLMFGAEPTAELRRAPLPTSPRDRPRPTAYRTDCGLWYFADALGRS